ncbi:ACBP-domain-containing protein [Backusella circina FSU 941]|nr:ACBP-domain-containing protein [Backusella circina FSU 941]
MFNSPSQYTERFIDLRFKNALNIIQNLSRESSFQLLKDEKLELYALYKQATEGDISIQRPGLFDVVGRAKWDAWEKIKGLTTLNAKHAYVEALLKATTEAYKRNTGREEAKQIVQMLRNLSAEEEEMDSDKDIDTSADEEEQAYLRQIELNDTQMASGGPRNKKHMMALDDLSVLTNQNPWSQSVRQLRKTASSTHLKHHPSPSPTFQIYSPLASSRASSVTITQSNLRLSSPTRPPAVEAQQTLERLQSEVISLNDRVDDLRRELVERNKPRIQPKKPDDDRESDDLGESWKWVIKAALKYAGVNLLTALLLLYFLYKNNSSIPSVMFKQLHKGWKKVKMNKLF